MFACKEQILFCFNSKYTAKIADICNELQKPQKFAVFFYSYFVMTRVCKVCNKFLKEQKRSNALYCGKRCKNKAVTLRKETSVLKRPQTPQIALPGEPLHNAPNLWSVMYQMNSVKTNIALQEQRMRHSREIDEREEELRQLQRRKENEKDEIRAKLFNQVVEPLLFGFTNFIKNQQEPKPQSGLDLFISSDDVII